MILWCATCLLRVNRVVLDVADAFRSGSGHRQGWSQACDTEGASYCITAAQLAAYQRNGLPNRHTRRRSNQCRRSIISAGSQRHACRTPDRRCGSISDSLTSLPQRSALISSGVFGPYDIRPPVSTYCLKPCTVGNRAASASSLIRTRLVWAHTTPSYDH